MTTLKTANVSMGWWLVKSGWAKAQIVDVVNLVWPDVLGEGENRGGIAEHLKLKQNKAFSDHMMNPRFFLVSAHSEVRGGEKDENFWIFSWLKFHEPSKFHT